MNASFSPSIWFVNDSFTCRAPSTRSIHTPRESALSFSTLSAASRSFANCSKALSSVFPASIKSPTGRKTSSSASATCAAWASVICSRPSSRSIHSASEALFFSRIASASSRSAFSASSAFSSGAPLSMKSPTGPRISARASSTMAIRPAAAEASKSAPVTVAASPASSKLARNSSTWASNVESCPSNVCRLGKFSDTKSTTGCKKLLRMASLPAIDAAVTSSRVSLSIWSSSAVSVPESRNAINGSRISLTVRPNVSNSPARPPRPARFVSAKACAGSRNPAKSASRAIAAEASKSASVVASSASSTSLRSPCVSSSARLARASSKSVANAWSCSEGEPTPRIVSASACTVSNTSA